MATAIVNFRIAPFNSVKEVKDHVVKTINDPNIEISEFGGEPLEVIFFSSFNLLWNKLKSKIILLSHLQSQVMKQFGIKISKILLNKSFLQNMLFIFLFLFFIPISSII